MVVIVENIVPNSPASKIDIKKVCICCSDHYYVKKKTWSCFVLSILSFRLFEIEVQMYTTWSILFCFIYQYNCSGIPIFYSIFELKILRITFIYKYDFVDDKILTLQGDIIMTIGSSKISSAKQAKKLFKSTKDRYAL